MQFQANYLLHLTKLVFQQFHWCKLFCKNCLTTTLEFQEHSSNTQPAYFTQNLIDFKLEWQ